MNADHGLGNAGSLDKSQNVTVTQTFLQPQYSSVKI